jgi:ABC-type transport system substrate-binding protein
MDSEYPILRCAYPELPRTLCPLMARAPVERHATSLVCESLVRWVDDPQIGSHYEPQLARGLPQPLAKGRAFELPRCRWPDDAAGPKADAAPQEKPGAAAGDTVRWCMVDDVRFTVRVLHDRKLPWYSPLYGELSPKVEDASDGDPFSLLVYLSKDYWQPLALMDFKILPSHCFARDKQGADLAAELDAFGRNPVGTGPYRLASDGTANPNQRRFVANPYYRVADQPYIREIVLQRLDPAPAVELFQQKKIDLIYGVQPEHVNQLEQQAKEVRTLRPPTVWFLAPNYRVELLKNKNLRLAIAHGIDREVILRQYFRPGRRAADHKVLNGPFPPDSWAHNPNVPAFSPARAKVYAEAARSELKRPLSLELAYPAGATDVEKACQQIESQLRALDITLELKKDEPDDFYRRVVDNRNFQLAYWSYTFPDVTYSLEPLLRPDQHDRDAVLRNAWNIMGYVPDSDFEGLFQGLHEHKQFREVQQHAHKIHEHVTNEAIIIPLWQLHVYVAVGDRLRNPTVTLDPLALFAGVEHWRLESRR